MNQSAIEPLKFAALNVHQSAVLKVSQTDQAI